MFNKTFIKLAVKEKFNFKEMDLQGTDLSYMDLSNANFSGANLDNADLSGSKLTNANLSGASLIDADLSYADFTNANLAGAKLMDSDCTKTNFKDADLSHADLNNILAWSAIFESANLEGACCFGIKAEKANFLGANLNGANMTCATLTEAHMNFTGLLSLENRNCDIKGIINFYEKVIQTEGFVYCPKLDTVVYRLEAWSLAEFAETVYYGTNPNLVVYKRFKAILEYFTAMKNIYEEVRQSL